QRRDGMEDGMNANQNEPEQTFNPLEQFLREQETAKAKVAAAHDNLVSYFQKRLQSLADEWRAANGVLNWKMPEFSQALDELQLRPVEIETRQGRKPSMDWEMRQGRKPMDWETRRQLLETF